MADETSVSEAKILFLRAGPDSDTDAMGDRTYQATSAGAIATAR